MKRGSFVGFVIEDLTDRPLSGVNVNVLGTNFFTASDKNGKFALSKIPVKFYSLRFSLVGFQELEMQSMTAKAKR